MPAVVTKEDAPGNANAVLDYLTLIAVPDQPESRSSSFLGLAKIPEPILQTKVDLFGTDKSCKYEGPEGSVRGGRLTVSLQEQQATIQEVIANSYLPDGPVIEIVCVGTIPPAST